MSELRIPVTEDDHFLGNPKARVTLVEYGDYQCPHCQAAYPITMGLIRHFESELRFVYRHFPMDTIHPMAVPAAESAEYAGSLGRFWEMHEALFANSRRLSMPLLLLIAAQLRLGPDGLIQALANRTFAEKVAGDFVGGIRSGVNGTPCFFVNGRRHDGGHDAMTMTAAIDAALQGEPAPRLHTRV
jgi:protein-disulfide isomerase